MSRPRPPGGHGQGRSPGRSERPSGAGQRTLTSGRCSPPPTIRPAAEAARIVNEAWAADPDWGTRLGRGKRGHRRSGRDRSARLRQCRGLRGRQLARASARRRTAAEAVISSSARSVSDVPALTRSRSCTLPALLLARDDDPAIPLLNTRLMAKLLPRRPHGGRPGRRTADAVRAHRRRRQRGSAGASPRRGRRHASVHRERPAA